MGNYIDSRRPSIWRLAARRALCSCGTPTSQKLRSASLTGAPAGPRGRLEETYWLRTSPSQRREIAFPGTTFKYPKRQKKTVELFRDPECADGGFWNERRREYAFNSGYGPALRHYQYVDRAGAKRSRGWLEKQLALLKVHDRLSHGRSIDATFNLRGEPQYPERRPWRIRPHTSSIGVILESTNQPRVTWLASEWLNCVIGQQNAISTPCGDYENNIRLAYATTLCNLFAQLGYAWRRRRGGTKYPTTALEDSFTPEYPLSCPWVTSVVDTTDQNPEVVASPTSPHERSDS
ncbi:hypothetical protein EDB86DRAFT_2831207 [Lactarius hatsudake]|nr:hypothetical protein EDB86DRAFT_2831207 [Lactarius hatsudake]